MLRKDFILIEEKNKLRKFRKFANIKGSEIALPEIASVRSQHGEPWKNSQKD